MAVTASVFTKLMLTQQLFVNKSRVEFREDPTNSSVDDTPSQTEVTWAVIKEFLFLHFVKNT